MPRVAAGSALDAASARVLPDPEPRIGVTRLAESGINISVNPWVNVPDYDAAVREINRAILDAFREGNVVMALPQREVRLLGSAA